MIGLRQNGAAARRLDRFYDRRIVGGDDNRADVGLHRAPPDMHDHRRAVDVGERLARQPGRAEAGGNEDKGAGHAEAEVRRKARAYTCCQAAGKAANHARRPWRPKAGAGRRGASAWLAPG